MNPSAGVARIENLVDTVSKTGFKGTPAFMSPEQLQVRAGRARVPVSTLRARPSSSGGLLDAALPHALRRCVGCACILYI